jgi:hypothetical protein
VEDKLPCVGYGDGCEGEAVDERTDP